MDRPGQRLTTGNSTRTLRWDRLKEWINTHLPIEVCGTSWRGTFRKETHYCHTRCNMYYCRNFPPLPFLSGGGPDDRGPSIWATDQIRICRTIEYKRKNKEVKWITKRYITTSVELSLVRDLLSSCRVTSHVYVQHVVNLDVHFGVNKNYNWSHTEFKV